jgi:hypothetical protein
MDARSIKEGMRNSSELISMLVNYLVAHGRPLFHATDETNLPSIAQHGLLSELERQARGIVPQFSGGNARTRALDDRYGLLDFVFLGFFGSGIMPAHKHEQHRRRSRTLYIHPHILHIRGARIAIGRANHARTSSYSVARATQEMDGVVFEKLITGDSDWGDIPPWKINKVLDYEVLIPAHVPPEYIVGID